MRPAHFIEQEKLNRMKQRPHVGPYAADVQEYQETKVTEGSKYRFFVLNDQDGEVFGYRLREVPIDKDRDYTNVFEDFLIRDADQHGGNPFARALEKFTKGNEDQERIIKYSQFSA